VSRGRLHAADHLAAFIADDAGHAVGLATYSVVGKDTELVSIDSLVEGRGVGTALLGAVASAACAAGSRRLWLVTSNDNLDALRFYQRRGLRLVAVHPGAVDAARTLKPQIPVLGSHGIPLHDEIELAAEPAAVLRAVSGRRAAERDSM